MYFCVQICGFRFIVFIFGVYIYFIFIFYFIHFFLSIQHSFSSAAYEDKETIRLFREGNMLREKEKHRRLDRTRGLSSASFFADMQAVDSDDGDSNGEDQD